MRLPYLESPPPILKGVIVFLKPDVTVLKPNSSELSLLVFTLASSFSEVFTILKAF